MATASAVQEALSAREDPELGTPLSALVEDVDVSGETVTVRAQFAGMEPATAEDVVERVRGAALELPGVDRVRVEGNTPAVEQETVAFETIDRVIAVASAKGGVGKTTVAAGLARALAADGLDVGLFDADLYGPNVPEVFDVEGPVQASDEGAEPVDAGGVEVMSVGLLAGDAPVAWRGAMAHEALVDLLGDTAWSDLDTLVVDLPPGTGDVVLTTLQQVRVDGAVLVTTPYPTSREDTERSAQLFREEGLPVLGAVVNMSGFVCPSCGDEHDLFGDGERELDLPVLAELPFEEAMRGAEPPAAMADLAGTVRDRLVDTPDRLPEDAFDVRTIPAEVRYEQVHVEYAALDPGETMAVVTAADPTPLAEALAAGDGPPVAGHRVWQHEPGAWVLEVEAGG